MDPTEGCTFCPERFQPPFYETGRLQLTVMQTEVPEARFLDFFPPKEAQYVQPIGSAHERKNVRMVETR